MDDGCALRGGPLAGIVAEKMTMSGSTFSRLRMAVAVGMMAALAACASPFNANVSRYTTQLPAPQGQTVAVVAADPAMAGGLEFSQYAHLVEAQMAKLGYAVTDNPANATMVVKFDYGVDKGRERVRQSAGYYRDPFWNP